MIINTDKETVERCVALVLFDIMPFVLQTVAPTSLILMTTASRKFSTRVFALTVEETC